MYYSVTIGLLLTFKMFIPHRLASDITNKRTVAGHRTAILSISQDSKVQYPLASFTAVFCNRYVIRILKIELPKSLTY